MTAAGWAEAMTVQCPHCGLPAGMRCGSISGWARKPHARRVRLARAVKAHADAALDEHFALTSPCGLCGVPGMPQRHRVVDAVAGLLAAGVDPGTVADELEVSAAQVEAVTAWMGRWPGAWL